MRTSQPACGLRLKAVGKRLTAKLAKLSGTFSPLTAGSLLQGEIYPHQTQGSQLTMPVSDKQKSYSAIEDPRVSRFSHSKILIIQKNLMMLTLLILFMGMMKVELDVQEGFQADGPQKMMLVMDITTLFIIVLLVIRKASVFELEVDQRKVYLRKEAREGNPSYFMLMLRHKEYLLQLVLEVVTALPHPSTFFSGRTYSFANGNYGIDLVYSFNDLLSVLMLIKIYIVIRSIVSLSAFATPRALRICHYSGIDHDFFFIFKCLQKQYPLRCTTVIFALSLLIFGYGFRVTEGQLSKFNDIDVNGFECFSNCYWCAFITMATIGYGDYIPTTAIAQFQAVLLAIIGVVLNSQLIMALTDYLKMKISEVRSHTTLQRLIQQEKLKDQAASAFVESIKMANLMTLDTLDPLVGRKLRPNFVEMKRRMDVAKAHHKRIKAIVPTETITEEMIKSFQLLKDNFKEIYSMQKKVKRKIEQMQERKDFRYSEMRKSFIQEMSNIMVRRRR